jgi:glyoxylase-like metal-dependent hydrolase (beta-lactamase superfamily II)
MPALRSASLPIRSLRLYAGQAETSRVKASPWEEPITGFDTYGSVDARKSPSRMALVKSDPAFAGGQMREIMTGIFTWPWFSEPHGYNFNGHLIRYAGGNLCIDPVEPTTEDLEELARNGIERILLTNRNHSRAANKVRARTAARTAIHPADAPHARKEGAELDDELEVGKKVGPFVVLGAPGKSPGEVALYWPERKTLVVGDAVVGDPPGRCKLLPEKVMDDPARLRQSVRALLTIDFDTLLVGDGEPILKNAKDRLTELVGTFPAD